MSAAMKMQWGHIPFRPSHGDGALFQVPSFVGGRSSSAVWRSRPLAVSRSSPYHDDLFLRLIPGLTNADGQVGTQQVVGRPPPPQNPFNNLIIASSLSLSLSLRFCEKSARRWRPTQKDATCVQRGRAVITVSITQFTTSTWEIGE